jgi:HD-GYP domain-containing protein (c-di-GMP phosphodiesterase class II)
MPLTDKEKEPKDLINQLSVMIKTAQLYHTDNIAVINAIKKFSDILSPIVSEGEAALELVGEFFHLNGSRIRYSMEYVFNYDFLVREFRKNELGSITFTNVLNEDEIKKLLTALISADHSDIPFETLQEAAKNIKNITIGKLRKIAQESDEPNRKKIIKKTYFNTVSIVKNISNKISMGEKTNLKKAKRLMEIIADQIVENESLLISMTTLKDYDEYTYYHSVNVCILSLSLGHRLGLSRKVLSELGLSALLHDIGKIEVPKEILNKPSEFSEEEWRIVRKHPTWGAWAILKIQGLNPSSMNAAVSAFEHHLYYDLSGYPKIKSKIILDLFSKIITIADQYDAMTSSRVYSRMPQPPDKALSIMVERSGTQLDPYFLKIFINMIGVYPIGTLVMLDTNELGLVFESSANPDFIDRPRVIVLVDSAGKNVKYTVDMMEKDDKGNFKRNIVKTLDPNQYKINLAEYLL